jgi:hypothetical protein
MLRRGWRSIVATRRFPVRSLPGAKVERAVITGNLSAGPAHIENGSKYYVQIGLNSAGKAKSCRCTWSKSHATPCCDL